MYNLHANLYLFNQPSDEKLECVTITITQRESVVLYINY